MKGKNMRKVTYSEKYGYSFPGKYLILGGLSVLGIFFAAEWPVVQAILGVFAFGSVIGFVFGDK